MTNHRQTSPRRMLSGVRDELRHRRQARAAYQQLERELASYATQTDVDDLLVALSGHDDPETEIVRDILTRNRHFRSATLAS